MANSRMKKLINRPENLVREALQGMAAAHGDLIRVSFEPDYVVRANAPVEGKVAIISGGGSGHEPMHAGFVGYGMLDAACPGGVFKPPKPDQIEAASHAVNGGAGILYIVKNYVGDESEFGEAARRVAEKKDKDIDVRVVLIEDDVANKESLTSTGRRGMGVTVVAEKMAGAAAEQKHPLEAVVHVCEKVRDSGRSLGVALTSCVNPETEKPTLDLKEDEIEFGVSIHGEPGSVRKKLMPVADVTEHLAKCILRELPHNRGDSVLALVSGMGGTPLIELYVVFNELARICADRGIHIVRSLVGSYITSLEMAGCSITLVKMDDEMTRLWDAPVKTPALKW